MWRKTAIKQLCKLLPKSAELAKAISLDDQEAAGKVQLPNFADMSTSTIDVDAVAESAQEPAELITKPRAKGEPQPDDECVAELKALESATDADTFEKVRGMAMCDDCEAPEMMDIKKVKELISLYKVEASK